MVDIGIEFVLENVKELISYNFQLLGDANDEVESLKSDLMVFRGYIKDSSRNPIGDSEHHQAVLNNIKAVVAKAEDAVDNFIIEKAKHNDRSRFRKFVHALDYAEGIRDTALEVKRIRESVDAIYARNPDLSLQHVEFEGSRRVPRQNQPLVEKVNVVGFDKPTDEIIGILMEDSKDLDVIGIVGMAGLGKTTLATKIYTETNVIDYEFLHRAWAFVSKDCSIEQVFISILKQVADMTDAMYTMTSSDLAKEVHKCLLEKKYLIVLDDVWTTDAWDILYDAFPRNKKGSRIILTTRYTAVATHANLDRRPHDLKFLTEDESIELLEKKVFGKSTCPKNLKDLLKDVANNCGKLPLAIVVIAGILLPQKTLRDWWSKVANSVNEFIVRDERRFREVIARSFDSLSYDLKLCFLYFGLLPRGQVDVRQLIELWIGEGFIIQDDYGMGLEDTAEALLDELVGRNLVMAELWRSNGRIKRCRVHDTLRVFCNKEARKQGLYQVMNISNLNSPGNYRRICADPNVVQYFPTSPSIENLRTFLTFSDKKVNLGPAQLLAMCKAFKRIRVLEVTSLNFTRFPKELGELVLLRYFAFSCGFNSITPSISKLFSLQTLKIFTSATDLVFDKDIWKLYQLRHLVTNASAVLPDPPEPNQNLGNGNMQTLSTIAPESCRKNVFKRTPKLKKLGVRGTIAKVLEDGSKLIENFGELHDLTTLKLFNDDTSRSSLRNISSLFPKKLAKLKKLTLSGTRLNWPQISILGELEVLEVLKLKEHAFIGESWEKNYGSFPCLMVLYIDRTNLKTWKASNEQFQRLSLLVLKNCTQILGFPSCFEELDELQTLNVSHCSKLVASAKELQNKKKDKGQTLTLTIYPPQRE